MSLYCGAGGIDEGLRQAGFKVDLAVDWWEPACKTLKLNHPETEVVNKKVADVERSIGKADMIVGGPPCPEFSVANTNRTLDPAEVNRFWRIVESSGAKHWIMENVPGVSAVLGGRTDGRLVNMADYGVPQTRLRMIYSDLPVPRRTHSERGGQATLDGPPLKKWVSMRDALGIDGTLVDFWHSVADRKPRERDMSRPSHTVAAQPRLGYRPRIEDRRHQDGTREYDVDRPAPVVQTDTRLWVVNRSNRGSGNDTRTRSADLPVETVMADARLWLKADRANRIAKHTGVTESRHIDEPAKTIRATVNMDGNALMNDGKFERKFTVRELARLQGFPDSYEFTGAKSVQMRQIGNAVPPPLIRAYAEGLKGAGLSE